MALGLRRRDFSPRYAALADFQHFAERTSRGVSRSRAGLVSTANADQYLRFGSAASEPAHYLAAVMPLDHMGERTSCETGCGAFQQHAGQRLTAFQCVFAAVVEGRQHKNFRVIAIDLRAAVTASVDGEITRNIDASSLGR